MRKTCWNIGEEDKGCLLEFAVGKYALLASPRNSSSENKCRSLEKLFHFYKPQFSYLQHKSNNINPNYFIWMV